MFVLLILASVSIAMLTGENGILTKATTAKENMQRAEVIERAQIDIVSAQAENDGKVTETKLKEVLNKYFDNVPETLPDDLSTLPLTTKNSPDTYLKQNDSAGTIAFCSDDTYSNLGENLTSVESINDNETIIADTKSAVYYARKYAESITGNAEDGRLMTMDEAFTITGSPSNGTISSPNWIKTTNYWLGSAANYANRVWIVYGEYSLLFYNNFYDDSFYGVRPVIEISKSSIQ